MNEGNNYELDFDTNAVFVDFITPDTSWQQGGNQTSYSIAPGTNVLTWTAYAYGDEDSGEVSFLDDFSFTPSTPSYVLMQNAQLSVSNFQFQFQSQIGHTHYVLSTTNLATGPWVTNSTYTGDGTLKLFTIPYNSARQQFFRVSTQ